MEKHQVRRVPVVDERGRCAGIISQADVARRGRQRVIANATADAATTATIKSKLLADTTVSGLQVDVETRDGVVTLSGTVRNAGERDRALAIARGTDGVKGVENKLLVQP